jgi:hypothetical protein
MPETERLANPAPASEEVFGEYGPGVTVAAAVVLVAAISAIDRLTGYDLQLGVLHLVPIAMVTWVLGRNWGLAVSLAAVAIWVGIFRNHHHYQMSVFFWWDGVVMLATFIAFVLVMARLREALRSHELALTALEKMDAPAYVVDQQTEEVLKGNRMFRDAFAGRGVEELKRLPAKESHFLLPDGRPALLRVLLP